jgi:pimeloyl-ACP methyl ester carboxylesterase
VASAKGGIVTETRTNGSIPLLLIHGAWLSARSWENFADYFAKRGFAVSAPEWPRKHGDVDELRTEAEELKGLGIAEIVDHYESLIRELAEPPILIGHSFGGLIVELLLDRGLGRAGVAISPAPPKGILVLPFSSLKAAAPALAHPTRWHGVVTLTPEEFTYAFVNTFSPEDAAAAYERYAVPETGQIFYEAGFANFRMNPPSEVDFKNEERAPLLVVGAEKDNTVPASLARKQYEKYQRSAARTDWLEFEGRPHLLMAAEGWEEVAASIDSWLDGVLEAAEEAPQHASA